MSREGELAPSLGNIAAALLDAGAVEGVCEALAEGLLTRSSTSVRHGALAAGSAVVESALRDLQLLWTSAPRIDARALALTLRSAAEGLLAERRRAARTEVVWTGPRAETSYLRSTRQVVVDIIESAQREVLVVGYWVAPGSDPVGIVPQIVGAIARAAGRGACVRVILDRAPRANGVSNRDLFLGLWPCDVARPPVLTWHTPEDDAHLKLHAKVIVADRTDALVTSANLTMHAMDLNMEMGVRVQGAPAASIANHFDVLVDEGTLKLFDVET